MTRVGRRRVNLRRHVPSARPMRIVGGFGFLFLFRRQRNVNYQVIGELRENSSPEPIRIVGKLKCLEWLPIVGVDSESIMFDEHIENHIETVTIEMEFHFNSNFCECFDQEYRAHWNVSVELK